MGSAASEPKVDGSAMGVLSAAIWDADAATSGLAKFGFDTAGCAEGFGAAGVELRDGAEGSGRSIGEK
jgi:hypothetical protein